jgi:hypothetical protein
MNGKKKMKTCYDFRYDQGEFTWLESLNLIAKL